MSDAARDEDMVIEKSGFYTRNKENIEFTQGAITRAIILLFVAAVSVQSFVNLEEGRFPFNTRFMARIAYRQDTPGDALLALLIGILFGIVLSFTKRFVFSSMQNGAYNSVKENFLKVRAVEPTLVKTTTAIDAPPLHKDKPRAIEFKPDQA